MQKTLAVRVIGMIAAAFLVVAAASPLTAQNLGNSIKVERMVFPVTLSSGPANVVGYLYYHGSYQNRPLQVLVHGATYNHAYRDFPDVNGDAYSYASYMAAQKYAVLAIDLPGAGESDKPAGATLGLPDTASTVRQVVDAMRSGDNRAGHEFGPIVLVGHSAGSIAATVAQGAWHVADALVITASRHLIGEVLSSPVTQQVLTLLIQLGTHDVLFPAAFAADELALWTSTTPDLQVIEGIGHDLNLHLNRAQSWQGIDAWIQQHVAPR
jgi:alpha-beta hydrolase superfamily lysophospholipase